MKYIIISVLSMIVLWLLFAMMGHECSPTGGPGSDCSQYQVTLEEQHLLVENCGRLVAQVPYDRIGVLDSIFVDDNE